MLARSLRRFIAEESGATAIEYGLLTALLAVALLASFAFLGGSVTDLFATGPGGAGNAIDAQLEKL